MRVRYPGAIHREWWMARTIYTLKIWIFHSQYEPLHCELPGSSRTEKSCDPSYGEQVWNCLKEVSLFVTAIHVKYWFGSGPVHIVYRGSQNDLNLLCMLSTYQNKDVAKAATTAFSRLLWYLSELLVGLAFFDAHVSMDEKRLVVKGLNENSGSVEPLKRIVPFLEPVTVMKGLYNFVTTSAIRFFHILELSQTFYSVIQANEALSSIPKKLRG